MALTKSVASVTDWTAVAAAAVAESATVDVSDCYEASLNIQAFLDSPAAHEGTEFLIQTSSNTTGDEDWEDFARFVDLIGTAANPQIANNPAAAGTTVFTVASTTGFTMDGLPMRLIAIEDATLANSEIMTQADFSTNTSVTVVDGSTNEHAVNSILSNIAISRVIALPITANRARVIVNNAHDDDGTASSLNYRVRVNKVTGV